MGDLEYPYGFKGGGIARGFSPTKHQVGGKWAASLIKAVAVVLETVTKAEG